MEGKFKKPWLSKYLSKIIPKSYAIQILLNNIQLYVLQSLRISRRDVPLSTGPQVHGSRTEEEVAHLDLVSLLVTTLSTSDGLVIGDWSRGWLPRPDGTLNF